MQRKRIQALARPGPTRKGIKNAQRRQASLQVNAHDRNQPARHRQNNTRGGRDGAGKAPRERLLGVQSRRGVGAVDVSHVLTVQKYKKGKRQIE